MSLLDVYRVFFELVVTAPLAVFLHELGHAVAGHLAGFVVTSFGLGTARPWCVIEVNGVRLYSCRVRPLQGITFAYYPDLYPSRSRLIAYLSGGILANAVSTLVGLALWTWSPWANEFAFVFFVMSLSFAVTSLIPYRTQIGKAWLRTDGALILQALRLGTIVQSPALIVQTLDGLRDLWLAVGDGRFLCFYSLIAATTWAELGDIEQAERLLGDAESIPIEPSSDQTAYAALARAQVALGRSRFEDADRALDEAESAYRASGRPAGLAVVALVRASESLRKGDANTATGLLDVLDADPIAKGRSLLEMNVRALRLQAACSGNDGALVADQLAGYERARRHGDSSSLDLQAYEAVARFRSRTGDRPGAVAAWRRVLEVIAALAGEWVDPERRARFLMIQAERIAHARADFEALGRAGELDQFLQDPTNALPKDDWKAKDRRLRRWALYGMLANLVTFLLVVAAHPKTDNEPGKTLLLLTGLVGVGAVLWLGYLILDQTIGRLLPALRRFSGAVLLMLVVYPWLTFVVLLMARG